MLKRCCALLCFLLPCAAAAQYPGDEYYPYAEREERRELLTTDSAVFYRAVQSLRTSTAFTPILTCRRSRSGAADWITGWNARR